MEVMYGAYYTHNPNALFLLRGTSFLQKSEMSGTDLCMPLEQQQHFVDNNTDSKKKNELLKGKIRERFSTRQVIDYDVELSLQSTAAAPAGSSSSSSSSGSGSSDNKSQSQSDWVALTGLTKEGGFAASVEHWFTETIARQYPLNQGKV
jgi:hypothetical protein